MLRPHTFLLLLCGFCLGAGAVEPALDEYTMLGEGEMRVSPPAPGGLQVAVTRQGAEGGVRVAVQEADGAVWRQVELALPGGGMVVGRPLWLDDDCFVLRTRSGGRSAGAVYCCVRSEERFAVTWVEAQQLEDAETPGPLYADLTCWLWQEDGWRDCPVLLLDDRPLYPVAFPAGERFAAWRVDSPSFVRLLQRSLQSYRQLRAEGALAQGLGWSGRSWLERSPRRAYAAACVNRAGSDKIHVLVLPLGATEPHQLVRQARVLKTEIPGEYASVQLTWMDAARLRVDAVIPGTADPVAETLELAPAGHN